MTEAADAEPSAPTRAAPFAGFSSVDPFVFVGAGWVWEVVSVDLATLSDKTERVNITLLARVLRRIDAAAKAAGESRSGFIARRALAAEAH